jgi:hypothetical protein
MFSSFCPSMWWAVLWADDQASVLTVSGRGLKRKTRDPHEALLRVHHTDARIYEAHRALIDSLVTTSKQALAKRQAIKAAERSQQMEMLKATTKAMCMFPNAVQAQEGPHVHRVRRVDAKVGAREVRVTSINNVCMTYNWHAETQRWRSCLFR